MWFVGFSFRWLLLSCSKGSRHSGLGAPWYVKSSWIRDQTCVPCIGRQILNHRGPLGKSLANYLMIYLFVGRGATSAYEVFFL